MRWLPLLALAAITACVDPQSVTEIDPEIRTAVSRKVIPVGSPIPYDVLFIIDDSPSIAPHRANLLATYPHMIDALETIDSVVPDLHVAVTTTDPCPIALGHVHTTAAVHGPFLAAVQQPDGTRRGNYYGSLENAFTALADVGASGCVPTAPLAAMRTVLSSPPDGFLRQEAALLVVFVTADDDHSIGAVEDYARLLRSLKTDPSLVGVVELGGERNGCIDAGVRALPARRLEQFLAEFPSHSRSTTICRREPVPEFSLWRPFDPRIWDPCFARELPEPVDCTVWLSAPSYERVLEPCASKPSSAPCWEITTDPVACPFARQQRLSVDLGISWPPAHTEAVADCVTR